MPPEIDKPLITDSPNLARSSDLFFHIVQLLAIVLAAICVLALDCEIYSALVYGHAFQLDGNALCSLITMFTHGDGCSP